MNRNALLKFHSKTKLRLILIMSKLGQCPHPIGTCTPIYWAGDKIPKWGFVCEICMASVYPYTPGVKLQFKRILLDEDGRSNRNES